MLSFSDNLGAKDGKEQAQMKLGDKVKFNWKAFNTTAKDEEVILYIQRFNYHHFAPYLQTALLSSKEFSEGRR